MPIMKLNDCNISYNKYGKGDDVVIFLHGLSLNQAMWDDQIDYFSNNYTVLTYDMRGYGKSSVYGNEEYSSTKDLIELMDALNISRAHIIGLSKGGGIALNFASYYPERILSLTLADSILGGYPWSVGYQKLQASVKKALDSGGISLARKTWMDLPFFAVARGNAELSKKLKKMVDQYTGWHWAGLDHDLDTLRSPAAIEYLSSFIHKTLIIVGSKDYEYFGEIAKILTDKIPKSELKIFNGAGHMVNMEVADYFNTVVHEFLDSVK